MKTLGKALKAAVLLAACTALLSANSQAREAPVKNYDELLRGEGQVPDMPENSYACQVQAKNGIQGLVLVQADNKKMAFDTASRSTALTMNGTRSETIAAVECIDVPKGRFTDSTFQRFFEEAPL